MDFISRRPLSSLLFNTRSMIWERVSFGTLEMSDETRFSTGLTPIPSAWSCSTVDTTFSSSSSPTQGTASKNSKHDSMHELKPRNSATCGIQHTFRFFHKFLFFCLQNPTTKRFWERFQHMLIIKRNHLTSSFKY